MPEFAPSVLRVAKAIISITPVGVSCNAELYLVQDSTKVVSSGIIDFISIGSAQPVEFSITMPDTLGSYPVWLDIFADSLSIAEFVATENVVVAQQYVWITPISATASGYTVWANTWYTGPPKFAIDGDRHTKWTLNGMGWILFDLGSIRTVKGINVSWEGSVSSGNAVNVFIDNKQVIFEESFGAYQNVRFFDPPVQGRYIKYQTLPIPHDWTRVVATWSEVGEFEAYVKSE